MTKKVPTWARAWAVGLSQSRPGLVKGAWSVEEDENLVALIGQGFSNWSELATHTPGRTAKQCRERWCHHLDPSVNHGNWTMEEDRQLKALQV